MSLKKIHGIVSTDEDEGEKKAVTVGGAMAGSAPPGLPVRKPQFSPTSMVPSVSQKLVDLSASDEEVRAGDSDLARLEEEREEKILGRSVQSEEISRDDRAIDSDSGHQNKLLGFVRRPVEKIDVRPQGGKDQYREPIEESDVKMRRS